MKANRLFQFLTLATCAVAFAFVTSCEGPAGPAGPVGPAGATGAQGPQGNDGTPGVAGTAGCLECHSSDRKYEVTQQYNTSGHSMGIAAAYVDGRANCATCHTNEGFIERMWSGEDETAASISFSTRISCTTCHLWHNESLDEATSPDYALRTNAPVDLLMYRAYDYPPVEIDLGDNGNLCVQCHQPRRPWEYYADRVVAGEIDQNSTHFGPHHGPQSTVLMSIGAATIGTTAYPTEPDAHGQAATCVSCHMEAQNHSFKPTLDGCNTTDCHNGSKTTLVDNASQVLMRTELTKLEDALIAAGLLAKDATTGEISQVKGVFPEAYVGALYNYEVLIDDRSSGLHNFAFVNAMIANGLEVLP